MSGSIRLVAEFTINEGQLATVKQMLTNIIDFVEAKDSRAVSYEFFFTEDEGKFCLIEQYKDSEAALAHMETCSETFSQVFEVSRLTRGEVFGNASDELIQTLAPFNPTYFTYWGGFAR